MDPNTHAIHEEFKALRCQLDRIEQGFEKPTIDDLKAEWLSSEQAQEILNVRPRTLQRYRETRLIGFSQVGHKFYFRASELHAHLLRHYQPSKSKANTKRS